MYRTFVGLGLALAISACAPPPSAEPTQSSRPVSPASVAGPIGVPSAPAIALVKPAPAKGARMTVSSKSTLSSHIDMLLSERPVSIDLATTSRFEYARTCLEPGGSGCASARAEILRDDMETSGAPFDQPKHESLAGQWFLVDSARPLRVSKPDPPPSTKRDLDRVRDRLTTDDPDRIIAALPNGLIHVGDVLEELDRSFLRDLPGDRPAEAKVQNAKSRSVVTAIRQEGAATVVLVRTDFGADMDIPTTGADGMSRARFAGQTLLVVQASPAAPVSRQTHTHTETSIRQNDVPSNIIVETEETTTWK